MANHPGRVGIVIDWVDVLATVAACLVCVAGGAWAGYIRGHLDAQQKRKKVALMGRASRHNFVLGDLLDEPGISDVNGGQYARRSATCQVCGEQRRVWRSVPMDTLNIGPCPEVRS